MAVNKNKSIEEGYKEITTAILTAASKSIPKGRRKNYKPFWTPELESKVKSRKQARKHAEKDPSPKNRTEYKRLQACVKLETKKAKRERWQKTCGELDLAQQGHKAWKLLHNLEGKKKKKNAGIWHTDKEIHTDKKKATILNKYFATVNKKRRRKALDSALQDILKQKERNQKNIHEVFELEFTMGELNIAMKKLKPRKAPGPDKITNEMLLNLNNESKMKILSFINRTWQDSNIPKAWRTATITPILKPGKKENESSSYRPISLTLSLGKLAERMVNSRLYWWLEQANIHNRNQQDFVKPCVLRTNSAALSNKP